MEREQVVHQHSRTSASETRSQRPARWLGLARLGEGSGRSAPIRIAACTALLWISAAIAGSEPSKAACDPQLAEQTARKIQDRYEGIRDLRADFEQANVSATESGRTIEKAAADKGYHAADTLVACQEFDLLGVKTYIPEPRGRRRWTDKTEEQKAAVLQNRARTQRAYGKRLQRKRSELVERSFAHVCDTGGSRRSWLRGLTNVRKRHLVAAAAHNLGLILRKLVGAGKPRAFHDLLRALATLDFAQVTRRSMLSNLYAANLSHPLPTVLATR